MGSLEAEAISLVGIICSFCNSIAQKISDVVNVNERVHCLLILLKELKDQRDDLKRQIEQAERQGLTCTSLVKGWLQRVEAIDADASLTMELVAVQRRRCCGCHAANCSLSFSLSNKVSKLFVEVNEQIKKGPFKVVAEGSRLDVVQEIPSRPAIGFEMMLERVQKFLAEDGVGLIGIYGMGGVGKTTLLAHINNVFLTKPHHFDVIIWVVVSKDFAADKIQQAVGARLGLSWEDSENHDERALKIHRIMRSKSFLLLLDDLWKGFDLHQIGVPVPDQENKCKVIFTARSLDVCSDMDAHRKLKLEFLGEEDSWKLFCNKAGRRDMLESQQIGTHAESIVRKCGGLPLALITIGKAMANKETEEEWKHAIHILDRSPSELRGMENVFTLLKFSYDNLANDTLRACFLYCSLFPEGYSIEKEQLIEYWIGEGFLDSFSDRHAYNEGHSVIGSLKVASLLENGERNKQVKMHDVVRSFALWIASEQGMYRKLFLVEAGRGITEAPTAEMWKGAIAISLMDSGITTLTEIPECWNLSTLLLHWNSGLNKIPSGFFKFMPSLRVLDLSFTSLEEIPTSINNLVGLHLLNLSGTKIAALPCELGELAHLRHLNLQRTCSLRSIPRQAISRLQKLRVLNLYYSYGDWEDHDCKGENEVGFEDLDGLKHLTTLGITVNESKTSKKLDHKFGHILNLIQYLYIKDCDGLFYFHLLVNSNFGKRLRRLSINNCSELEYLQVDQPAGKNWLSSLEVLSLDGLPNLTTVWRNPVTEQCLQNLRSVSISHCHKLRNVSWVLQLSKLEMIYLIDCEEMEEVISMDVRSMEEVSVAFPCLRTLSMQDLPKVQRIILGELDFPSLESIAVIGCPMLERLPTNARNLSTVTVYGNQEWWNGLEWDEAITESGLLPQFMPNSCILSICNFQLS